VSKSQELFEKIRNIFSAGRAHAVFALPAVYAIL